MLRAAKRRAKDSGIEFGIELAHIRIPERCPILGLKLHQNGQKGSKWSSPSLDRVDNALGYVPGNIAVVSFRANTLKSNATLRELELLGTWAGKKRKRKRGR